MVNGDCVERYQVYVIRYWDMKINGKGRLGRKTKRQSRKKYSVSLLRHFQIQLIADVFNDHFREEE